MSSFDFARLVFLVISLILCVISTENKALSQESIRKGITFWLLDEDDGTWRIPLPNWNVDDIMRAVDNFSEKDTERPYTIQSINANGKVENGIARLTVQYRIFTNNDPVVRVPLGLSEGIYIPGITQSGTVQTDSNSLKSGPTGSGSTDKNGISDIYQSIKYNGISAYYIEFDPSLNSYVVVFQNKNSVSNPKMMSLSVEEDKKNSPAGDETKKEDPKKEILPNLNLGAAKEKNPAPAPSPAAGNNSRPEDLQKNDQKKDQKTNNHSAQQADQKPALPQKTEIKQNALKPPISIPPQLNKMTSNGSKSHGVMERTHFLSRMNAEINGNQTRRGMLRHTLTFSLCFPVETTENNEFRLKISFPPAVSGKIRLEVPLPDVQFSATQGILAMPPVTLNETTSEITLNGLNRSGKPTEIIWSRKETHPLKNQVVLQIEDGEIDVVPSHQDVQMDVTLPVRVNGGETDTFRIRIPGSVRFIKESLVAAGNGNAVLDIRSITEEKSLPIIDKNLPDPMKSDPAKSDPTKSDPTKSDPTKSDPTKSDPTKSDPTKSDPTKSDPTKSDPTKSDPTKSDPTKSDPTKSDPTKSDPTKSDPTKSDPTKSDPFVSEEVPQKTKSSPPQSTVIEIRLTRAVSDSVTFRFKSVIPEMNLDKGAENSAWLLEGFELLGAQKQYGQIRFLFPKDLTFKVTPKHGVRFNPVDEDNSGQDVERYLFYTQPFAISLQAVVQQTRIKVKPEYQISVGREEVQLHALFQFAIYGSKVRQLALKTEDWFVREIKSNYIVDYERIYEDPRNKELVLPLTAPSEGQLNIELTAVRKIDPKSSTVHFQIPVPVGDWVESGPIVILPDDNIEILPQNDKMIGLRTMNIRAMTVTLEWPTKQQTPIAYLMENRDNRRSSGNNISSPLPEFTADLKYHSRQLEIRSDAAFSLENRTENFIRQTLTCLIKYEPLESLSLSIPAGLKDPSALKILVDGKPVPDQNIVPEAGIGIAPDTIRKKIVFSEKPRIGECVLSLVYPCKNVELLAQMTNKFALELVQPIDGIMMSNRFSVVTPSGVKIESGTTDSKIWTFDEEHSSLKNDSLTYCFNARTIQPKIVLNGVINARDIFGTTLIERTWIQSWLVNSTRLDRAAWRIVSDQPSVSIKLPNRVRRERVSFLMNGKPIYMNQSARELSTGTPVAINDKGELLIAIPDDLRMKPITIESSWLIDLPGGQNLFTVDFPKFTGNAVTVRQTYWQVILPSNRHLLGSLTDWTSEYFKLVWSGLFWKRQSALTQDELSTWIGVAPRDKIPQETNIYLFSSFNIPPNTVIHTLDRSILILFASGIALAIGFGFIYIPMIRNRAVIMLFVILLSAACSWHPSDALILLQAATFGILLTLLTLFLAKIFGVGRTVTILAPPDRTGHQQISPPRPKSNGSSVSRHSDLGSGVKEEARQ